MQTSHTQCVTSPGLVDKSLTNAGQQQAKGLEEPAAHIHQLIMERVSKCYQMLVSKTWGGSRDSSGGLVEPPKMKQTQKF